MKSPKQWPASRVETWPIDKIKPYPKNPRTHSKDQIAQLAKAMAEDGVTMPILVDEKGVIIAGHGRRLAAIANGYKEFPVAIARGWTEQRKRATRLKDNQLGLLSGWDNRLVAAEIGELRLSGYNIGLLGFPEAQLRIWDVSAAKPKDPDETPEPPAKPMVRKGDLWALGDHRILCGDAMDGSNWVKLMGLENASMAFTDPPYGVSYESDKFEIIQGDRKRRDELYRLLAHAFRHMGEHTTEHAAFYIWHASSTREDFAGAMKAAGLVERQYLMWVKPGIVFGRADYQWQHEPCFYAAKGSQAPAFYGERAESTVWNASVVRSKDVATSIGTGVLILDGQGGTLFVQAKAPKGKKLRQIRLGPSDTVHLGGDQGDTTVWQVGRDGKAEHPTQKPVELARRAIENSSRPGEIVIDGFSGSGTTLIGAEMTGRRAFVMDLDPAYVEVGIRRWERFTNRKATRMGTTPRTTPSVDTRKPSPLSAPAKRQAGRDGHHNG